MLSVLMLVMGLAPILAPLVGGQLLVNFGWRSVFWVLAAYGTLWLRHRARSPCRRACRVDPPPAAAPWRRPRPSTVALLRDRAYIGYVRVGRPDLLGAARLHRRVAVRVHRAVRRPARALRAVFRRQCHRHHRAPRRSTAGSPTATTRGASSAPCCRWRWPRGSCCWSTPTPGSAVSRGSWSRCSSSSRATAS